MIGLRIVAVSSKGEFGSPKKPNLNNFNTGHQLGLTKHLILSNSILRLGQEFEFTFTK